MFKKLFIFLLSFTIMTILVGCDDDDFAPYTNYEKNLNETISSQPSSIFDIANEVTNIAQEYKARAELRYAKIVFKDYKQINDVEGNILFEFYSDHETKNQTTRIVLDYNMSINQIDKLEFEQGHGKRIGGPAYPIDNELAKIPITELISDLYSDNEFQEKIKLSNPRLEIKYKHDEIVIYLYDNNKDKGPIYRKLINNLS